MLPTDPRLSALRIVCLALTRAEDLQAVLDRELELNDDQRNKALITEIVYGYLRYRARIDYVVNLFLSKPQKLPFKLKILLGLAGYEIHFLDRVPDYASVSRAVDLSRRIFGRRMSGLINAVLRKVLKVDLFDEQIYKADNPGEIRFWSRYYSCPEWIVKMWKQSYGSQLCLEYLSQSLGKPPLGLREGRGWYGSTSMQHVEMRLGNSVLIKKDVPDMDKYLQADRVFRQSFAGQQALHKLGMKEWKGPVWDMCAGSGGKSLLMLDQGLKVYSSDVSIRRLKRCSKLSRDYDTFSHVFAASGKFPPLKNNPPTILIDAPCSGLGVLSRRPDIKWKRKPVDIDRLSITQTALLSSAASMVGNHGRIVYLTCTLCKNENERRINDFLYKHNNFTLENTFQTDPGQELREFFYGAVLKKS